MESATDKLQKELQESLVRLSGLYGVKPSTFLLAVSGGIDSVVLATIFHRLGLNFTIAHFDHGLRCSSRRDADFVETFSRQLGVRFFCENADPYNGQDNIESWARSKRYGFLQRIRDQVQADLIVTAHHQRDQAETVLLKLFAGKADSPISGIDFYCPERKIFRPIISTSKETIIAAAEELAVKYVQDETNEDTARSRNWIRKEILPRIRTDFNPQIDRSLEEVSRYFQNDDLYLEAEAKQKALLIGLTPQQSAVLSIHPALCWRVLREIAIRSCGEEASKISRRSYARLIETISDGSPRARRIELGFGFYADCSQGLITFCELSAESPESVLLEINERVQFNGYELHARLMEEVIDSDRESPDASNLSECFDADCIVGKQLFVRTRREGDLLRIAGRGTRKLKKMFQEQGLMLTLRDRIPIVECDGSILWVPGVARSEIAPVTAKTAKLLVLTCYKNSSI